MSKSKLTHVLLGRFSPFQKGHQMALARLAKEFGVENCLVIIGSINTRNERTPYTFNQRKEMVKTLFPRVKVIGLPDGKAGLVYFDGSTNDIWLDSIEAIQKEMETTFVFYGGCAEDLQILSERFETKVLTDRNEMPHISATNVRKALDEKDIKSLEKLLDPKIAEMAIKGYEEFINLSNNE